MTRSGWLMRMPSTVASADAALTAFELFALLAVVVFTTAVRVRVRAVAAAWPRETAPRRPPARARSSSRRLSSRRPWKTEWRMRPSGVHSPNETSATSLGSTQWPRTSRGFSKNGVVSAGIAASAFFTAASVFWSKPLPTPPAKRRWPASSWMPSSSEPMPLREPFGSV